jgi:prepilin-type N-terminal cleavage/methylation domain-containing protein
MLTRWRAAADDSGFTLVELLLVIVILGVVTVPLADMIIGALRQTDQSSGRLAESHDAQISAAYWAADVASMGTRSTVDPLDPQLKTSVETNVAYNAGLYPCGTAGTPAAVVRFAWDDVVAGANGAPATTTLVVVAYLVKPAGSRSVLHRLRCNGSTTPVSDTVLAHDLVAAPSVQCDTGCSGTPPPRSVQLQLTIQDPKSREANYVLNLGGNRRQE